MTDAQNPSLENSDPSTIDKKTLHEKADDKNFVRLTKNGKPVLACGARAKNKRKNDLCCLPAGSGTPHVGYGRCKYHGGLSTGPITPEGKAKVAKNSTIHGLYAEVLGEDERKYFNAFLEKKDTGLELEIYTLKAKIMSYLAKWRKKWDTISQLEGEDVADRKTKVMFKESEGNATSTAFYHAGTIEDRPLIRALETLGRLIEKHARLNPETGDNLLDQVNKELRDASYGQVNISWGGGAQQRKDGGK